jgi:hypothetical protein
MNRLRKQIVPAALALGVVIGSSAIASAAVWDFQSDTVGAAPTNGLVYSDYQLGTQVKVVDSGSTPADPFGGSGNHSLWMEDTGQSNSTLTWGVGSGNGFAQGTIKAQVYVVDDANNTLQYFGINGGIGSANTGAADLGPWLMYKEGTLQAIALSGTKTLTTPVPVNTVLNVVVNFDSATHTYTGSINGNPLTDGTTTTFDFFNTDASLTELESVRIVHATSIQDDPSSSTTFYDNVSLNAVPEPTSGALLLGGLLMLTRRRKSRS